MNYCTRCHLKDSGLEEDEISDSAGKTWILFLTVHLESSNIVGVLKR